MRDKTKHDCASVVWRLTGTIVNIVGTTAVDRQHTCRIQEDGCGLQLVRGSKVCILREQSAYRDGGEEEDVLAVYALHNGMLLCMVVFLAQHLAATQADDYDGLHARISEVYSERCTNIAKRQVVAKIMDFNASL